MTINLSSRTILVRAEVDGNMFTTKSKLLQLPEAIGASRVTKNILKSERMMWKFLDDPENIPLTNNHAER